MPKTEKKRKEWKRQWWRQCVKTGKKMNKTMDPEYLEQQKRNRQEYYWKNRDHILAKRSRDYWNNREQILAKKSQEYWQKKTQQIENVGTGDSSSNENEINLTNLDECNHSPSLSSTTKQYDSTTSSIDLVPPNDFNTISINGNTPTVKQEKCLTSLQQAHYSITSNIGESSVGFTNIIYNSSEHSFTTNIKTEPSGEYYNYCSAYDYNDWTYRSNTEGVYHTIKQEQHDIEKTDSKPDGCEGEEKLGRLCWASVLQQCWNQDDTGYASDGETSIHSDDRVYTLCPV